MIKKFLSRLPFRMPAQFNPKMLLWAIPAGMVFIVVVVILLVYPWSFVDDFSHSHGHHRRHKHLPHYQSSSCPDVELVAIPGTWETSLTDDPIHPHFNKHSLLLHITRKVQQQFPASRVEVYTIPYPAQFRNPSKENDMTYGQSRMQGQEITEKRLTEVNDRCPLTKFIIIGYSQGAVIAGDIASDIGNDRGVIDDDRIALVGLISDARRVPGTAHDVGVSPEGQGAEVSLEGFNSTENSTSIINIPQLLHFDGISLRGEREGGFGTLSEQVMQLCAPHDFVCDCPQLSLTNAFGTLSNLGESFQPIHGAYNTTHFWEYHNKTAVQWLTDKVINTINDIKPVPHRG